MDSLLKVVDGDIENGLVFAGSRVGEIKEILPVQTIIDNLSQEYDKVTQVNQYSFAYKKSTGAI